MEDIRVPSSTEFGSFPGRQRHCYAPSSQLQYVRDCDSSNNAALLTKSAMIPDVLYISVRVYVSSGLNTLYSSLHLAP